MRKEGRRERKAGEGQEAQTALAPHSRTTRCRVMHRLDEAGSCPRLPAAGWGGGALMQAGCSDSEASGTPCLLTSLWSQPQPVQPQPVL